MAESSIDSFVYVIWAGTILGAVLITMKLAKFPRNHFRIINNPRSFTRRDLLQINATIIAGLLILITIQSQYVGGITSIFDEAIMLEQIKYYEDVIANHTTPFKDNATNTLLLNEARNRLAQTQLDYGTHAVQFNYGFKVQIAQFFFNPITILTTSMGAFVFSCLSIIAGRNDGRSHIRWDILFTYLGFFIMAYGLLIMIGFPKI